MKLKLTKNEKFVLKSLVDNGRSSDTLIASKIKISPQAARKIRKKFENNGTIKRYSAIIDYQKIGINAFAIVQLKINEKFCENFPSSVKFSSHSNFINNEKGLKPKIDLFSSPHIIGSFKLPETNITNIFIAGFNSLEELDSYFAGIKEKYSGLIEIQKMNIISNIGMMKNSPAELLKKKIDEI